MNLDPFPCGEETQEDDLGCVIELRNRIEELETDLANMTYEKDCQFDRAQNYYDEVISPIQEGNAFILDDEEYQAFTVKDLCNEEILTIEGNEYKAILCERLETFEKSEEELDIIKDKLECLKTHYERLSMGVLSEIDEIIKLTDELIELHQ